MNFFIFLQEIPNTVVYVNLIQLNIIPNMVEHISIDKCYNETQKLWLGTTYQ